MSATTAGRAARTSLGLAALLFLVAPLRAGAQNTGTVLGTVTRQSDGARLGGVAVSVEGTNLATVTGTDGAYTLPRVPAGAHALRFRWLRYRPQTVAVTVEPGHTSEIDVALAAQPVTLAEVVVTASRRYERVMDAPSAISLADVPQARTAHLTGQVPAALANVPGVDLVQSGVTDFNVNARGFNSSLNRRVLVLQDGRDLAITFLGAQEWAANPLLDEAVRIELVRGPGSALYGANAFSGVLAITTPAARETPGTRLALSGGELGTFRADVRHAGALWARRVGYRLTAGLGTSDTWSRSRTSRDGLDLRREYAPATDRMVSVAAVERRPLNGQDTTAVTGTPTGDRAPLRTMHGAGRIDLYADNGAVGTAEGGVTLAENELYVTGIGRVQVARALRPWARVALTHPSYTVMAWYSGRRSLDPQIALLSGATFEENSGMFHLEGQVTHRFGADRGRVVLGASLRRTHLDTKSTLMHPANDGRSDAFYSGYSQVEYRVTPRVRVVAAARVDDGDLLRGQFSPRAAVVVSPNERHAFRATVSRAFQSPNYAEFFLRVPAAAPATAPRALEFAIEQFLRTVKGSFPTEPSITALALPDDLPWDFDSLTQALALGNEGLDVEGVTAWEVGYKGTFGRAYVTLDGYVNLLDDFVTDLLPAVNLAYPRYLLTDGGTNVASWLGSLDAVFAGLRSAARITPAQEATLRGTIAALLDGYTALNTWTGSGLATLPAGTRALVLSYTNAGRVIERGVEAGAGIDIGGGVRLDGSYTFFDFEIRQSSDGDSLKPNTPTHKGTLSVSYLAPRGLEVAATVRLVDRYDWAAGVFAGSIPASQTVDLSAAYRLSNTLRLHVVGTNLLDQMRYHMYGGSVVGRRILGGVTANF
ncbi:MAG: TonB-dependent receptor [Gemmatimonadetes bacterium]|nr:TonB-dependent receptor [Gemmatimonadota bacterium]